eukprot:GHVP01064874.1.p1 GENE.GHVP01064874.1~~GHVP01064874.1.p1  ORF type:complete len:140 (+),score=19.06 GHVP01064874.1:2-421(+)
MILFFGIKIMCEQENIPRSKSIVTQTGEPVLLTFFDETVLVSFVPLGKVTHILEASSEQGTHSVRVLLGRRTDEAYLLARRLSEIVFKFTRKSVVLFLGAQNLNLSKIQAIDDQITNAIKSKNINYWPSLEDGPTKLSY